MADEDFGIRIKIDPTSATPAIAGLKKELDALEAKGPSVGKGISQGLSSIKEPAVQGIDALRKVTDAFAKMTQSINLEKMHAVGQSFAGLSQQMEREARVLDQIRGPQRRYMDDLQALDGLLQRQVISTKEYAEQVTKLNQTIEKTPQPGGAGGGMSRGENGLRAYLAQTIGGGTSSLFTGSSVAAAALAGGAAAAIHLGDSYIQLRNQAERLASSEGQVDSVLNQQMTLSRQLHSSMSDTIQLSATMKEHLLELNLTTYQQQQFTKEWGEVAVLTNHQIGESGANFERLSTALQSGMAGGRGLRQTLTEFPPILAALEAHFHTTEAGIFALGKTGKLSMNDVITSLREAGTTLDQQMGARVETADQQWQHFKDQLTLSVGKLVESTGAVKQLGDAFATLANAVSTAVNYLQQLKDLLPSGGSNSGQVSGYLDSKLLAGGAGGSYGPLGLFERAAKHNEDESAKLQAAWKNAGVAADDYGGRLHSVSQVMGGQVDTTTKAAAASTETLTQHVEDFAKAASDIRTDRIHEVSALFAGLDTMVNSLAGHITNVLGKAIGGLATGGPMQAIENVHAALDPFYVAKDYTKHDNKVSDETKYLEQLQAPLADIVKHEKMLGDLYATGRLSAALYRSELEKLQDQYESLQRAQTGLLLSADYRQGFFRDSGKYGAAAGKTVDAGLFGNLDASLPTSFSNIDATLAADKAAPTAADLLKQEKAREDALKKYEEQAKSTAEHIQHAFEPFNKALITAAEGGKVSFEEMGRSMLESLGEAILKAIELKAIMSAMNVPTVAGGGSLLGGLASVLGFAQGGSMTLPAAAQGLSGVLPGAGRTDSHVFAFRYTPGEHLTVQTPSQHAAAQKAQGTTQLKVVNVYDPRKAAIEALNTREGEQVMLNFVRNNVATIRGWITKT